MDGKILFNGLAAVLDESDTSAFLSERTSYDFFYEAACELVRRTQCLTATQSITTVAGQTNYDLNADYLSPHLMNSENEYIIKYNDGTNDYWLKWRDYDAILRAGNDDSVSIPWNFSVTDKATLTNRITGTATSAGVLSNGEATLTDSTDPFADVKVGDPVHNITDGADGIVISVTSTSALVTAMFGGTENDWDNNDSYVIVPSGRKQLILDPPPLTSGHTITFYYLQRPEPVYSHYRTYRFDPHYKQALIMYAAWLYKYKDSDPNYGDKYYTFFDNATRISNRAESRGRNRGGIRVNLKKRSLGNRSYR